VDAGVDRGDFNPRIPSVPEEANVAEAVRLAFEFGAVAY